MVKNEIAQEGLIDKEFLSITKYKGIEAKTILLHNKCENRKPKLLDLYLDKVARVAGVSRDKKGLTNEN